MKEVLLVLIGVLAGWGITWLERRNRIKSHRAALGAEVRICLKRAQTFLTDRIAAPAYRAPMEAHDAAFPSLLTDGTLSGEDVDAIEEFYAAVGDFNRCLDYVHEARDKDQQRLEAEYSRTRMKAQNVIDCSDPALNAILR